MDSLLGPLQIRNFIKELPDVLNFSEPYLLADYPKIHSMDNSNIQIQLDLDSIDACVSQNEMSLALDK